MTYTAQCSDCGQRKVVCCDDGGPDSAVCADCCPDNNYSGPDDIGDTTGNLPMDEAHRMEEARRLK